MTLLLLSYPLTPVTPAACGGTEQVAWQVLGALSRHRSLSTVWVGAPGSPAWPGIECLSWNQLLSEVRRPPLPPSPLSPSALAALHLDCRMAALHLAAKLVPRRLALIHNLGALWTADASGFPAPFLFSLHLARCLYPPALGLDPRPGLHLHCVSHTQARDYGATACCGVIRNGIDLASFPARRHPPPAGAPLLFLGRICPEKAPHAAITIARRSRRPLWMVGAVAPFPAHQQYFRTHILPHLGPDVRWLPPPTAAVKRKLLAAAAALVIPSRVSETSSIAAMEAAATGVPVLAARIGALPEIVVEGTTGFLGSDAELAAAVAHLSAIAPAACRRHAERSFCGARMTAAYLQLYRRLMRQPGHAASRSGASSAATTSAAEYSNPAAAR